MKRKVPKKKKPVGFSFEEALKAMNAEELRELANEMFLELDNRAHNRVVSSLMERAARGASGPLPEGPSQESIAEIMAFAAYKEAAEIVTDKEYAKATFLDGVALAAQELGKKNLSQHLERAWRQSPTLLHLIRWLGTSKNKATITKKAKQALDACPQKAHRQRAFLHLLLSDFGKSAKLLGAAKGLGWSDSDHPGHLIFPLFYKLLGGDDTVFESGYTTVSTGRLSIDDLEYMSIRDNEPTLVTPTIDEVLALDGLPGKMIETSKNKILQAMKKAAENRVDGVTSKGRRKYYSHAAQLVSACLAVDNATGTVAWFESLRQEYRRYPALQAAFSKALE